MTMDLTVLILTYNEQYHIRRCLQSLKSVADRIFIVDSFSTDCTIEIANSLGSEVVQRKWKNYADQFQWAIENCSTQSGLLMRMDADEYLEADTQNELSRLKKKFLAMLMEFILNVKYLLKVNGFVMEGSIHRSY